MTQSDYNFSELIPAHQVYPLAYGNEEETGMMDNISGELGEPAQLAGDLEHYLPSELEYFESYAPLYLQNGGKIYQGGSDTCDGPTNIERATPECISPTQLNRYIRAGELLLVNTVGRYLSETSKYQPGTKLARIQRRVIDGHGNRKGCHDNFGFSEDSPLAEFNYLPPAMLGHLASRSFITGAGLVTPDGTRFAQKIGGLQKVDGYGYFGSMYRISHINGTPRLEIRSNDINLSEWAVKARLGTTAIAIALNQTSLGSRLVGLSDSEALASAQQMNVMKLNADGSLLSTPELIKAVDLQRAQVDLALSRIHLHTEELSPELTSIAREVYDFCDDFNKVLAKSADIELLANRADWAAKFSKILKRMNRDVSLGLPRTMTDITSQASDMQYDYIRMEAQDGQLSPIHYGYGYQLREKGYFKSTPLTEKEINDAYLDPPVETRASIRGKLISEYFVAECDWDHIALFDDYHKQVFVLKNVQQTELNPADQSRLNNIKQRRVKL